MANENRREMPTRRRPEDAARVASQLTSIARHLFVPDHDAVDQLPVAQLRVCGILYRGRRTMSALGRELSVSQSAMTQIADRLERAGLVRRVAEENDRRVKCLELTARGEKIMRRRDDARLERVQAALARLSDDARRDVPAALEQLLAACAPANGRESVMETAPAAS
jgi:DNA-binding MarR family transcriptional regulator